MQSLLAWLAEYEKAAQIRRKSHEQRSKLIDEIVSLYHSTDATPQTRTARRRSLLIKIDEYFIAKYGPGGISTPSNSLQLKCPKLDLSFEKIQNTKDILSPRASNKTDPASPKENHEAIREVLKNRLERRKERRRGSIVETTETHTETHTTQETKNDIVIQVTTTTEETSTENTLIITDSETKLTGTSNHHENNNTDHNLDDTLKLERRLSFKLRREGRRRSSSFTNQNLENAQSPRSSLSLSTESTHTLTQSVVISTDGGSNGVEEKKTEEIVITTESTSSAISESQGDEGRQSSARRKAREEERKKRREELERLDELEKERKKQERERLRLQRLQEQSITPEKSDPDGDMDEVLKQINARRKAREEEKRKEEEAERQAELENQRRKEERDRQRQQRRLQDQLKREAEMEALLRQQEKEAAEREAMAKRIRQIAEEKALEDLYLKGRHISWIPFPTWKRLTLASLYPSLTFPIDKSLDQLDIIPEWPTLFKHFEREGRLEQEALFALLESAQKILDSEPNVLNVSSPAVVIGDLHGQFFDLLKLLEDGGFPYASGSTITTSSPPPTLEKNWVFLGDYIDRGNFSTEVVLSLATLKISYPKQVFLLRGNHEARSMSSSFNFGFEYRRKYPYVGVSDLFFQLFDSLPLTAVIHSPEHPSLVEERFICVHGGIGPDINSIEDLNALNRKQEPPSSGAICDLLWADPDDFDTNANADPQERTMFRRNTHRHCSYYYGIESIRNFLEKIECVCLIRGHQVQKDGFQAHFFEDTSRSHPYVYTIFSAPNYCGIYQNHGAFLEISGSKAIPRMFKWVESPYYLPRFQNVFEFSLEFVYKTLTHVALKVIKMAELDDVDEKEEENKRRPRMRKLSMAARLVINIKKVRAESPNEPEAPLSPRSSQLPLDSKFETIAESDSLFEARPDTL